ncbi:2'-5' RNA ligase family protein [Longispora albida]|uniref:2'-5' RNA ligase family protein n=1 Tax=Longispora albida TaxID=203523 RepID=UPI000379AD9B|nr:2'-5' RNA ligase family protein [Longispora albida]
MTVVNHWTELPRWSPGRALYSCYLTFAGHPALHQLIDTYQTALADLPNLDLILPQWRHMTIQGITFTDELTEKEMSAIEAAVRKELSHVPPLTVWTEPEILASDSVYIPVGPIEPLTQLREAIRAGVFSVVDESRLYALPGQETGEFEPHVSVAYVNADGPAEPFRTRLAALEIEPVELRITEASLIALTKDDHKWSWTREVPVPLGG